MTDIDLIKREYEGVVSITPITEYGEHYYSVQFPDETIDVMVQDGSVLPLPETMDSFNDFEKAISDGGLFYKNNPNDIIWWKATPGRIGEWIFSFDKKTCFNMFADYPYKLTPEQKEIFDKENPYWKEFFSDRQ